jgi:hypothetical protein
LRENPEIFRIIDVTLNDRRSEMKRLSLKGIVIGCLVDWLGTLAFGLAFAMGTGMMAALRGVSPKETELALTEWYSSIPGMVFSILYGFGFTLLGGYVAARISKAGNLLNSALVGTLGILSGLVFISEVPKAVFFVSILLSIPVSILGGFCYTRKWKLF